MVDYEQQQILQKLEDDKLAEARQQAQEDAQKELEQSEESRGPVSTEEPTEGLDEDEVTD